MWTNSRMCTVCGTQYYGYHVCIQNIPNYNPWPQTYNSHQKCPICEGKGQVRPGFYLDEPIGQTNGLPATCRRCKGIGTI